MKIIDQSSFRMVNTLNETIPFLVNNKLWKGFFNQKTVLYLTILLGLVIPFALFKSLDNETVSEAPVTNRMGITVLDTSNLLTTFSGFHKYIILILFSMLITYLMHKTIDTISGYDKSITIKDYISSLYRNILLSIRSFMLELFMGIMITIIFGIFGPDWLVDIIKFFIGAFFVGYVFFDSYFYLYKLKIKEAKKKIHTHIPAAVILGTAIKLIFAIPFLGAIFGSIIGAVAATWYLHTSEDSMAEAVSA